MQARKIAAALGAVARHPADVLRFALAFDRDDGRALGWWLRKGLTPAARRALGAAVLAHEDVVLEFDGGGYAWAAPTGDEIAVFLFTTGDYSGHEAVALTSWLNANRPRDGTIVIDVGANIGTTSLPLASAGHAVLAYEPVPQTFGFLRRNVDTNGFGELVTCKQAAIADRTGTIAMVVTHALGESHIIDSAATSDRASIVEVPVTTLERVLEDERLEPDDIAFIWCDAEGAESKVIAGGAALWSAGIPLYAECGHEDVEELVPFLHSHFESFLPQHEIASRGDTAAPHAITEIDGYLEGLGHVENVLFLP